MPQHADSLRAVLDSVFAAPRYHWTLRPQPLGVLRRWWDELTHWVQSLQDAHPVGYRLLLAAAAAILLAVLGHAAWVLLRTMKSPSPGELPSTGEASRHDEAWYRHEADRLAAAGRFADAVQADFVALLLALDARRIVTFHPSKTPGEYADESRLPPDANHAFRDLVRTLYGYAFARWPCGPGEFAEWRARASTERYAIAD